MANFNHQQDPELPDLPVKIIRIEVQKKNTFRYSLFGEQGFIIGVSDSTLTKLNLKKGSIISKDLYLQIEQAEERWKIREYFLRLLGRRDHASFELKQKGYKKDYSSGIMDEIIEELESKGYINNLKFAEKFVHDKFEFNQWGPNKIRNHLFSKKIDSQIIDQAIQSQIESSDEASVIRELFEKKKPSLLRTVPEKRKKKLFDYLVRKGFNSEIIFKNINKFLNEIQ